MATTERSSFNLSPPHSESKYLRRLAATLTHLTDSNLHSKSITVAASLTQNLNMKALILVGGYGTRLRPLTFSVPKPLVPFCNLPIVLHQIEALVKAGVKEVILAVNYQPEVMIQYLKACEAKYGITITCSQEDVPMGTAGPLALARKLLTKDNEPFFMLNSDVICEFPLVEMLKYHTSHGGEGTILVTEVKDPSKYGVVVSDPESGKIEQFVEKPQHFVSNKINAGIYLFTINILNRIELRPTSIEREIFPKMAADGQIYSMVLPGYWMDIGQPKDFLAGTALHLLYMRKTTPEKLAPLGPTIIGNVLISSDATVGADCVIGPDVVIGAGCVVGDGARIKRSTIMEGAKIKSHAVVSHSVVGWKSSIGQWARVTESVLGEDVHVANEVLLHEATVCPHKDVKEDSPTPKIIL